MKTINEVNVPEKLSELTLGQFIRLQQYTGATIHDQNKAIGIMCKVTEEEIGKWDVETYYNVSMALLDIDYNLGAPSQTVTIGKQLYTLREFEDLTAAEFVDFDTLLGENNASVFSTLAALAYTDNKTHKDYVKATNERGRIFFEKMDAFTAMSAVNFFVESSRRYAQDIADSSELPKEVREAIRKTMALTGGGGN